MLGRVVEDWLTNVNELGYEDSFLQALVAGGHTIVHKQQHGGLELGKDLITKDRGGEYCCYQLKGGSIDQGKWAQIASQIDLAVSSPIFHPNVPTGSQFKPFLVTNGEITDPVRADIVNRNLAWTKQYGRQLQLVLYHDLLGMFVNLQGSFLPTRPSDFQLFLTLYLADKTDQLDAGKFSAFLKSMLPASEVHRAEVRRLIGATTIVADYIISGYENKGNFYSAAEAWTLLLSHLLRTCELLPPIYQRAWRPAVNLVRENQERCVLGVVSDAMKSRSWMEGNYLVDDAVQPYRKTMLVGMLAAFLLSCRIKRRRPENEDDLYICLGNALSTNMWGEGAAPGLFMAAQYLAHRGREKRATDLALKVIDVVTDRNKRSKGVGLADPYYTIQHAIRRDLLGESIYSPNQSFLSRSFCIRQFVEFVVRRDWRRGLLKRWYQIAEIDWEEFVPKNRIDAYYWYCDEGLTSTRRWGHPQSWSFSRRKR